MSYKIVDEVVKAGCISPNDKLVLISLASHAANDTRIAYPSVETMEWETSLSRRSVQRSLRHLETLGIIVDVTHYAPSGKRKAGGKYHSVRYCIADVNSKKIWDALFDERRTKPRRTDAVKLERASH